MTRAWAVSGALIWLAACSNPVTGGVDGDAPPADEESVGGDSGLAGDERENLGDPAGGDAASGDSNRLGDSTLSGDDGLAGDTVLTGDAHQNGDTATGGDTNSGGDSPTGGDGPSPGDDHLAGDAPLAGDTGTGGDTPAGDNDLPVLTCANEGLCVELTWDESFGDLDLHLARNNGAYCGNDGCYFGNCKESSAFRVEWDGLAGVSAGDPELFDDNWGEGPEIVRIATPAAGTYRVGVRFEAVAPSSVVATLRVFSQGNLVNTVTRTMNQDNFWEAVDVTLSSGAPTAVPVNRYCGTGEWTCLEPQDQCTP